MVNQQQFTRRRVLRTGAATAGLLATSSLAGCGILGGGGGAYSEWLPAPDEIESGDHSTFTLRKPKSIAENEDNFDEELFDRVESDFDVIDADFDEITSAFGMGPMAVFEGEYEESAVIEQLEDDSDGTYEEDDEVSGYKVFIPEDADNPAEAFGVSGSTVVRTRQSGNDDAVDILETVLETKNGEGTRYTEDNEDFGKLADELGSGTFVVGGSQEEIDDGNPASGSFDNQVAAGARLQVNGETTDAKYVRVLEEADDYDDGDVEDWIEDTLEERDAELQEPSQSTSGRAVVVTGTIDTDELTFNSLFGF